ncbi:hypothetical protein ACQ4M4_25520 [Leptolyngbya sp. AN02str]|uniref:hypothetical protein n=1 Tax=Leptolyngbya sp. AN02str TaxID=3423363 RepID=UPI003D320385
MWPSPSLANAGTPLLWTGLLHLFLGNLILGYVEAGLLSRLFGVSRGRSLVVLILANYASAWAGALLLVNRLSHYSGITLENVQLWLGIFVILAFVLTLLIEYPFFWILLRQRKQAILTALKATLLIHGISYLLLFGWYGLNSQTSLLTQLTQVPGDQLQLSRDYTLHYLSLDETQAFRSDLGGANPEAMNREEFNALASELKSSFGPVPKLTEATEWDFYTNVFAGGGLSGYNRTTQERIQVSLETPFAVWAISHAAHLAGDVLVFQLGQDQICLLHLETHRIALIARGKHPVVTGE